VTCPDSVRYVQETTCKAAPHCGREFLRKIWSLPVFARIAVAVLTVSMAAPAFAQSGVQIPEPGDAALFVVAVVGLIVGRHASRRAPRKDEVQDDTTV
jgi:hypothetical protein